jgi:hypothetical protein
MSAEEAFRLVGLAESQRDFGLEQLDRLEHSRIDTCREPLAGHLEPQSKLVDHLQRRHARAGFEARDVGGGAARKGELPLRHAGPLARRLQANPELAG